MKELLYIPSGEYFKFYSEGSRYSNFPSWSIEELLLFRLKKDNNNGMYHTPIIEPLSYDNIIKLIIDKQFNSLLYSYAHINYDIFLYVSEFEIVEV